jgi:signal transduction histidine kinase
MRKVFTCGCPHARDGGPRVATDVPIEASTEDLRSIRNQLGVIEQMLATLFGTYYNRECTSLRARAEAGNIIERHFDGIVGDWAEAIGRIFEGGSQLAEPGQLRVNLASALVRFVAHLRNPDDLRTYIHLRRHCQEGMLSRAKPSQFNAIHISLKQVILKHVRAELRGQREEIIRNTVVAAVDERRLMVSQFYIESRERALRVSEEKYRNSIDHAPDPMYELDPGSWLVMGANAAAERLHRTMPGEPHQPLVGQRLPDLVSEEMRAETLHHLRSVVRNGSDQVLDLPLGGRYFDLNSALIPFGNKQFIQMILHDVTQRREILEELVKAERLAAAGTFAAGVAHEVNNPLASISSLVQSLLPGDTDADRSAALRTILSQITRISSTLKDLVNFARPSSAHCEALDLNALVDETLRLVAYDKRFKGISLERELAPGLKAAFADKNESQQLLLNLLFNAADATTREGGVVRVLTANQAPGQDGERVRKVTFRVVDNGIGIPREHLERIFDPFFTTKSAGSGVGLGLSICQRIILANHGSIRVESESGKGTAVTICLPVPEEDAEAQAAGQLQ